MSSIIEKTNDTSERNKKRHGHHAPVQKVFVDMVELLPASSSAWIMTKYMNQLCKATRPPDAVCYIRSWLWLQLLKLQLCGTQPSTCPSIHSSLTSFPTAVAEATLTLTSKIVRQGQRRFPSTLSFTHLNGRSSRLASSLDAQQRHSSIAASYAIPANPTSLLSAFLSVRSRGSSPGQVPTTSCLYTYLGPCVWQC